MDLQKEEQDNENTFEEGDVEQPIPPSDIVAYNELRSCADLVRMVANGHLEIKPDFQRDVVWDPNEQTRFIDSLVKQLPIPSMCFSLDYKTQQWKVIDGLQRMSSIVAFLSAPDWRLADLQDIHPALRGALNSDLREGDVEQKRLYMRVQDVTIPVTVIRCDYTQRSHMLYLFTIFHRLNSGGTRLTNQEIRNCIYSGVFNDALKSFDKDDINWLGVKKRIWGSMDRYRSIEVLLRVLAFGESRDVYDGNLAKFLNVYMHTRMSALDFVVEVMPTLQLVAEKAAIILTSAAPNKLSLMVVEALLVALYVHAATLPQRDDVELVESYLTMLIHPTFSEGARYAISSATNVKERLDAAVAAFEAV